MLPLVAWILILVVSLAMLVKGSDWFTEAAERLSKRLGISPFLIGVTVVAIGTSLPELASSIAAVMADESAIVAGNVVGSNITNTLLILGVGAIIAGKLGTKWPSRKLDFIALFGATFLITLFVVDGRFTLLESIITLTAYCSYIFAIRPKHKMKGEKNADGLDRIIPPLLIAGILIYAGAAFTVESVIAIAALSGVSSGILALTVVALGTSLPELAVTMTAAWKKKTGIALGNIVGSNIFNLLGVMGISGLFGTLLIERSILSFAIPVLLVATILFWFVTKDREIRRWEGWALVLLYAFFVVRLFI